MASTVYEREICVADAFPDVADAFPDIADAFPDIADAFPDVADAFPDVADAFPDASVGSYSSKNIVPFCTNRYSWHQYSHKIPV